MSSISDSFKSRFGFGFHDRSASSESTSHIQTTPNIPKSPSRNNLIESHLSTSNLHSESFELHEDPSFWKDHNVQVIIRVRPLSNTELSTQGYNKCVKQDSVQTITWSGHPESRFTFDAIADENVSQEKLFKVAGVPMVENCVGGYNSCMFAYGQTGSGKTHTMLGDIEGGTRRHSVNCGMTPRVFEYLFQRIQKEKEARREEKLRFTCKCSFLEIYNEQILDLLDPSSSNLQIREDLKKGVYVENLKEIEVATARDVVLLLLQGAANRKVAATNMNLASSRSHSVFTCIIESKWESQGVTHHRFARLNLVDLAGSERQKSSGAEGERLKEATNINKSLSTLGLVIMNLVSISNGKALHVPYRDSKLTFLLQDSLGGNSKTIIIANISPSISCSLETLSTLKFAQRAKFIKNNAIVNEDTSGDVLAMRLQIQQLKKEIAHLRELTNGGAGNQGNDMGSMSFPSSPGSSLNWDGLHASFSPLATKRMSNRKEFEAALVGAFRREQDKEISLQALSSEHKAALQLAKQREDEIKSLKMRLRFRESAIKRLEGLASGNISAECHLLKEKEEYMTEIEVLRSQVDKNQEVTRFAMENLRLKEEIRRLKSFYEEGEREMMKEQITVLQNKLLEALDWKLMHESDSSSVQKRNLDVPPQSPANGFLVSGQEPGSPWLKSNDEENEFLRMEAIQNQSEINSLRKKLNICLEDKEKLERGLNDLEKELERPRSSRGSIEESEKSELKTMVDAISAASQREAEAHETAIFLSKENEELRMKIKVLVEDNTKLIELYERATTETRSENVEKGEVAEENDTEHHTNGGTAHFEEEKKETRQIENLEHQFEDLQEENKKLMGLYEKAMQERDEFKRTLSFLEQSRYEKRGEFDRPEKLVEIDRKESAEIHGSTDYVDDRQLRVPKTQSESGELSASMQDSNGGSNMLEKTSSFVDDMPGQETCVYESTLSYEGKMRNSEGSDPLIMNAENRNPAESTNKIDEGSNSEMDIDPSDVVHVVKMSEDVNLAKLKLDTAHEKLLKSAKTMIAFSALEKAYAEADNLYGEIESMEHNVQAKKQEIKSFKTLCSDMQEKRSLLDKKLLALKHSVSKFTTSAPYYEQRGDNARVKVDTSLSYLNQKKEELVRLEAVRAKIKAELMQLQQSEVELRNSLACLKPKMEEKQSHDNDAKVLFPIDNIDNVNNSLPHRSCLSGKATELLKSEERLVIIKREIEALNRKLIKTDKERENVEAEIQKSSKSLKESQLKLHNTVSEQKLLAEMIENAKTEFGNIIIEYQESTFKQLLKESELEILEEELCSECRRIEEVKAAREAAAEKKKQLLVMEEAKGGYSNCLSEKLEAEIQNVQVAVREVRILLDVGSSLN